MPKLFIAICAVALMGAGCADPNNLFVVKFHDEEAGVTCWKYGANAISCVPDSHVMFPSKIKNNCPYTVDVTSMEEALAKKCLVSE